MKLTGFISAAIMVAAVAANDPRKCSKVGELRCSK